MANGTHERNQEYSSVFGGATVWASSGSAQALWNKAMARPRDRTNIASTSHDVARPLVGTAPLPGRSCHINFGHPGEGDGVVVDLDMPGTIARVLASANGFRVSV